MSDFLKIGLVDFLLLLNLDKIKMATTMAAKFCSMNPDIPFSLEPSAQSGPLQPRRCAC